MKTFKQYISEADEQLNRRGFLRGLAAFAASAAVPAPVVKLLSTPAGVASLPIPAGIALLKGIQEHLDQWDPEDDDDYYEAWEDMAGELGFEDEDAGDEYGESAQDKLADIVNLYRENPELAAAQLIQHLQTNVGVSPKEIKPSLGSRADNPNDWRYHDKQKGDAVAGKKESELAKLTRLAAAAQSAANANFQQSAGAAAVKHMGPVQYAKDIPALPAPTKPEFDLAPDLKQKEKVPVNRKGDEDEQKQRGLDESTELSDILKNAGLKTSD
jgi:DNA-binding transcriptional MerR regulator